MYKVNVNIVAYANSKFNHISYKLFIDVFVHVNRPPLPNILFEIDLFF